jgi:DNA-binding transcriptional MerR regulator
MRDFGIGELAGRTNVPVANIRYYEEIGILPKAARRNGRHRTYDENDIKRLAFIRGSRELGFSLQQVRTLIHLSEPQNLTCTEARDLSKVQLTAVRKRIKELRLIEVELSKHLTACDALCSCGRSADCPVLSVAG